MTPDNALKPCPNHSRYTEGCTACFVETGTSGPDAELAAMEPRVFHDDLDAQTEALSFLESQARSWAHLPGVEIRHDNFERSEGCVSTLWAQGQVRAVAFRTRNDFNRTVLVVWITALASTAGTDFAERLRRAEEENAELKARWNRLDIQLSEKCGQLATVTAERDEARAKLKATENELFDSKIVSRNRFDDLMTAHEQRDGWKARATAAEAASDALVKANPPIGKGSMDEC